MTHSAKSLAIEGSAYPKETASLQFSNPPMEALRSKHENFAMVAGRACKYPAEVTPFAAIENHSTEALQDLFSLMTPGEATYVVSETPLSLQGLHSSEPLSVKQMTYPCDRPLPVVVEIDGITIEPLSCANAAEMVELTSIAFPGFFRIRTCEMGNYYGIRSGGRLVAMCGERMAIRDYREISGLCTHPDFRGRGYAAVLMTHLLHDHREAGVNSYLHVSANNVDAIALYERMGFEHRGEYSMYLLTRSLNDDLDGYDGSTRNLLTDFPRKSVSVGSGAGQLFFRGSISSVSASG